MTRNSTGRPTVRPPVLLALSAGVLLLALAEAGCQSAGKPASASFAAVDIQHRTMQEIRDAAGAVFRADGWEVFLAGDEMIFSREGSRANQLAYGGYVGDRGVGLRVRASVVPLTDDTHRLQCKAYIVKHPNDAFFEEEVRLSSLRSGRYQKLLDEVAKRLRR